MNEFVRRQYPNVQRVIFASKVCPSPAREITQMTIIRTSAVNRSLLALNTLKVNFSDLIQPRTKEYLCDTIFSSPVAQKLFPDNSIVLDWIPMRLHNQTSIISNMNSVKIFISLSTNVAKMVFIDLSVLAL